VKSSCEDLFNHHEKRFFGIRGRIPRNHELSVKLGFLEAGALLWRALIPPAGLGTRLLSVTNDQRKEILRIFAKGRIGDL
jgi:hypothetical protein